MIPERPVREEPAVIKEWREKQTELLRAKDEEEEKARSRLRDQAAQELADWYAQNSIQVEKLREANREAMENTDKTFVAQMEPILPGTEWDRYNLTLSHVNHHSNHSSLKLFPSHVGSPLFKVQGCCINRTIFLPFSSSPQSSDPVVSVPTLLLQIINCISQNPSKYFHGITIPITGCPNSATSIPRPRRTLRMCRECAQ